MKRRDFFGYSMIVLADAAGAQTPRPAPPSSGGRPDFERIAPPGPARGRAQAEPHMRLVELETDVLVAGGGLAGVCAAIAAARQGARVVLVQDRSRLGGNSSSEVKMHVVGANQHTGRPGWREGGLIEELRLADAVNNPQRCWELWDLLLYDKVVSEPNITLLLETVVYSAAVQGRADHTRWLARCDKSEHLYRIKAKIFCDCTGDSRLGLEAGAEMRSGRETRTEFNESLAPEKADNENARHRASCSPPGCIARPMPFTPPKWARKITKEHLLHRKINSWEYGYWWIEWGGDQDIMRDNERIRFELLSIVMGVWDYIKNSGEFPDSKYWAMDWVGMMPGKRGSRRLVGDHILTQQDLMKGRFRRRRGHRRLGHGRSSAGRLRPPRPAAEYAAQAAGGLRHPAALAVQPQYRQPDDGGPEYQRHARGVHVDARDGDVRRRSGRRWEPRRPVRGGWHAAARSGAATSSRSQGCSRRCCATTRPSRACATRTPATWPARRKSARRRRPATPRRP